MSTQAAVILVLASMALGCGGDAACVPGEQVECACPGGTVGAQACNADGSAFGECSCDGTNPSAGGGGSGVGPNPCEALSDKITTKFDECEIAFGGAGEGGASPCDAEAQATAACLAPCVDPLTCAILNGDDLDGLEAYGDCVSAC